MMVGHMSAIHLCVRVGPNACGESTLLRALGPWQRCRTGYHGRTALLEMKALADQAVADGKSAIDPRLLALHTGHIRSAALIAVNADCRPGDVVAARHRALARRILERQADYLRFATDFRVPFDRLALICSWLAIAHSASAITSGTSVRPSSVTSYSTRGGTSA
ncbi:MAG: hypothetical protein JWP48_7153 [Actinoallomurus sp.]|jgi:ATPase subunit of ABC transporter with duplicated ATPase domains|nr:hypothetical protein [Actinoallomurus sp.]